MPKQLVGPWKPAMVGCGVYLDGVRQPGNLGVREAYELARSKPDGFVWVGLHEPSAEDFADVADVFGLHPLAAEDAVQAHQRPKLEQYGDSLFLVLKTIVYVEHAELTATSEVVDTGQIMVFAGPQFVVVVRHGSAPPLISVRRRLEADPAMLAHGPAAVVHAIVDRTVDDYLAVTDAIEDDFEELEAEVFSPTATTNEAERIYQLKRELMEFQRAAGPLVRPLDALAGGGVPLVDDEMRRYMRDVADHLAHVRERLAGYAELLDGVLSASLARVGIQQNTDMRKISASAALLAVPTLVAGIYGMNFDHMPELHETWGYPAALGFMAAVCGFLYRAFRRNGWL
ncbi:magnesium and cobalt transport protein CorA [Yinghuangia seranimata]|uniref:magnesium and cobalt transport protein CorA n=1 Tax=Yinghuangia seranimata TaxID=408067 RepID=UPI00248D0DDF|nr:magnesium and cobalt transport protein CorA [Yinghuangia seranimata]MDI2130098.1 magnesium and cobalt transport protein CorA [Yinghuangia seranimata]